MGEVSRFFFGALHLVLQGKGCEGEPSKETEKECPGNEGPVNWGTFSVLVDNWKRDFEGRK